jgi:hypothetical protein
VTEQSAGLDIAHPRTAEAQGLDLIGYSDLDGRPGFKLAIHRDRDRWILYAGHLWHSGWTVVDITDPTEPVPIGFVEGPSNTWTLQVQAANGLLVTALERPQEGWGFDEEASFAEGIQIFDIATNPTAPRLLGTFRTEGTGTHRNFYDGGRYAYLAANPRGFHGNLLVIVDLEDPRDPREVSRWWVEGQHVAGGEIPDHEYYLHGPAYVRDGLAYLGYGGAGMVILDVSDPAEPHEAGRLPLQGFGSVLGCHSAVPIPGTDLVAVNSEAINEDGSEPHNYCFLVDASDRSSPWVVGAIPQPTPQPHTGLDNYFAKGGRFGPHNQHHPQGELILARSDVLFMTWFNAGLRVFDIGEPRAPREVAWYVPETPLERKGVLPHDLETQFEDVLVDRRGNIFCTDKNWGLFVLRGDGITV